MPQQTLPDSLKTANPDLYDQVSASPEATALCLARPGHAALFFRADRVGKFGDGSFFAALINSAAFQQFMAAVIAALLGA